MTSVLASPLSPSHPIVVETYRLLKYAYNTDLSRFPGALPLPTDHAWLSSTPFVTGWLVTVKTNGLRLLCVCGTVPETPNQPAHPFVSLVNRRLEVFQIPNLRIPDLLCTRGTIFDGEWSESTRQFFVFDLSLVAGEKLSSYTFRERYAMSAELGAMLMNINTHVNDQDFRFHTKDFQPVTPAHLNDLFEQIRKNSSMYDGLIFQLDMAPLRLGRDPTIRKWKMLHTVDFLLRCQSQPHPHDLPLHPSLPNWHIQAYYGQSTQLQSCTMLPHNMSVMLVDSECLRRVVQTLDTSWVMIGECSLLETPSGQLHLQLLLTRHDKYTPNNEQTVHEILDMFRQKQHVTEQDMCVWARRTKRKQTP